MGSDAALGLVQGCLGTNMVRGNLRGTAVANIPRKNPLSIMYSGICLSGLSGRLRREKLHFAECTSSMLVFAGDRVTTGQIVGSVDS